MSATKLSSTIHIPQHVGIEKLLLGLTMRHITVCFLRTWEVRNFEREGELVSLDALLINAKDSLIHASIHHQRIPHFQKLVQVGKVYTISNFEVVPAYERYKVTNNVSSIRFTDTTEVVEDVSNEIPIKVESFRLSTYPEYLALSNTNIQLLGQILSVQGFNLHDPTSTQKIVMLLLLEEGTTVRVTGGIGFSTDYHTRPISDST
ncbi:hypothetical protein AALP_AA3G278700 [Arabis alpina]|uniref:Replication protein A 70 kDa DNA-binding subunit B/D first OB fold domain-containing protein n=1 Tax=Arabis alpina TaxID=50452 RepID=A0A087HC62_ARAAL|nr:hypothetical protein AALP_AA3G278700 [Arabis alpina]